MLLLRYCS